MKKIIALFLAFSIALSTPFSALAGYAQLKPPAGWSSGMGAAVPGTVGTFTYGAAANGSSFKGSTVLTNAALNVAGSMVTVPVSMRYAANAAGIAATYSFGNPLLFVGVLAAVPLYDYFKEGGLEIIGGAWQTKYAVPCTSNCVQYRLSEGTFVSPWSPTLREAFDAFAALQIADRMKSMPAGAKSTAENIACVDITCNWTMRDTYITPPRVDNSNRLNYATTRTVTTKDALKPSTVTDFENRIAAAPLPEGFAKGIPAVPLPVELPAINPLPTEIPSTNPSPSTAPSSRPQWIPTGEPVKQPNPNPGVDPDRWIQPGVKVTPAPTPTDPWRVDSVPEPITKNDPSPSGQPATSTPVGEPVTFETCGLPGKPKCLIEEAGTPAPVNSDVDSAKLDAPKSSAETAITGAASIAAPTWSFSFALPTGCAPYQTGLRGVVLNICQFQPTIHDLMSMVWAATTAFAMIGMVGRTIRES